MAFKVNVTLRDDIVENYLCSAFEGGSNYWIDHIEVLPAEGFEKAKFAGYRDEEDNPRKVKDWYPQLENTDDLEELAEKKLYVYSQQLPFLGGAVKVVESEGYCHDPKLLNAENLQTGLQLMHDKHNRHFTDLIEERGDSITGDVLLQLAIFGVVIYG